MSYLSNSVSLLLVIACALAVVVAEEESQPLAPHEYIADLDKQSFKPFLKKYPVAFIKFYTEWCPHSRSMHPEYVELAEKVAVEAHGQVGLGQVNCDSDTTGDLCDKNHIEGYPTLIAYRQTANGKIKRSEFRDKLTADEMERFLRTVHEHEQHPDAEAIPNPNAHDASGEFHEHMEETELEKQRFNETSPYYDPATKHPEKARVESEWITDLDAHSHDAFLAEEGPISVVTYYKPDCEYSRAWGREYAHLVSMLKNSTRFAQVDCSHAQQLCELHAPHGHPTIILGFHGHRRIYTRRLDWFLLEQYIEFYNWIAGHRWEWEFVKSSLPTFRNETAEAEAEELAKQILEEEKKEGLYEDVPHDL